MNVKERKNRLSWEEYFMEIAKLSAKRSADPHTQVGACIVQDNKIIGIGYNGMPKGCEDLPWNRESGNPILTKYPYVCHAEMNAILNMNPMNNGDCIMYCTLFPCNECAKIIIQRGCIKHIVYLEDKYPEQWPWIVSRLLLNKGGVTFSQYP